MPARSRSVSHTWPETARRDTERGTIESVIPHHLRALFWDVDPDGLDPTAYPVYTIERVLEHGNDDAIKWLRSTFSEAQIRDVLLTDPRLTPRSANFWALIFDIPITDVAALR